MDEERYNELYNRILDGENWDYSTLEELLQIAEDKGREKVKTEDKTTIKVHCLTRNPKNKTYFFTKDDKHCVCIEYNPEWDFGNGSPSGSRLSELEIHTNNGFTFKNIPEVQLSEVQVSEVPECIIELLSYLK